MTDSTIATRSVKAPAIRRVQIITGIRKVQVARCTGRRFGFGMVADWHTAGWTSAHSGKKAGAMAAG